MSTPDDAPVTHAPDHFVPTAANTLLLLAGVAAIVVAVAFPEPDDAALALLLKLAAAIVGGYSVVAALRGFDALLLEAGGDGRINRGGRDPMSTPDETPETAAEETARLEAETTARDAVIAARVAKLEGAGVSDELHGALSVLLNTSMVPEPQRADAIVAHVLRLMAEREVDRPAPAPDLSLVNRVEVIDSTGRAFSKRYPIVGATIDVQDGGRTLKLFADGRAF
ncbi:MAG: hypothetical protein J0J04_07930 [Microbacterium sp.]|uniref:hypothetical protein n=1 Tax=Microbacterium sp. TaxID=51671 RepID=UPI001ACDD476|nr:hypothetical protein [Microbacterium sp.]MBN9214728.1 hypothetical protein [Microbacterium sp.]